MRFIFNSFTVTYYNFTYGIFVYGSNLKWHIHIIYKIVVIIWIVQRQTEWQLDTKTIENRHNFPWTSAVAFPSLSSGPRQFSPNAWLFRKVIIAKLYEINGQSKYAICVRVCMLVHGAWCTMHTSWDMMMNDERVFCIEFSEAIVE